MLNEPLSGSNGGGGTSSGVSEEELRDTVGYAAKNHLKIPASVTTKTKNGVIFEVDRNEEGEVTSIYPGGTATADTFFEFYNWIPIEQTVFKGLQGRELTLTGGIRSDVSLIFSTKLTDGTAIQDQIDEGNGVTFTLRTSPLLVYAAIKITSGTYASNEIIYPMLRDSSVSDSTFKPYCNPIINMIKGKNILNIPSSVVNTSTKGINFTIKRDIMGAVIEIDADGTSTDDISFFIGSLPYETVKGYTLTGGIDYDKVISARFRQNSGIYITQSDRGSGVIIGENYDSNGFEVNFSIEIREARTLNHVKFYPMVSKEGGTFEPYRYFPNDSIGKLLDDMYGILLAVRYSSNFSDFKDYVSRYVRWNPFV